MINATLLALTLSTIMTLSQSFSDGVEAMNKKKFKNAITAFDKVIAEKKEANPLMETALYLRSQCHTGLKDNKSATADIKNLLENHSDSKLVKLATANYKKLTGKDWTGLNLSSPDKTWDSIVQAIQKRDVGMLSQCCQGEALREIQDELMGNPDSWNEVSMMISMMKVTSVAYNKAKTKAKVNISSPQMGGGDGQAMLMHLLDDKWVMIDEYKSRMAGEFEKPVKVENLKAQTGQNNVKLSTAEAREITLLIKQLGGSTFNERRTAYDKLKNMGVKAATLLRKATSSNDPEVVAQAKKLLSEL